MKESKNMKKVTNLNSIGLLSRVLLALTLSFSFFSAQAQQSYVIGPGDLIDISVYEEADLSFPVRISESGTITFPFIGEIQVVGNTTNQFESLISEKLVSGEFLLRPEVTVNILEYRPFYIDGEVANPGSYPFEPGLTLRKAIAIAGGFTERASRSKISISSPGLLIASSGELLETPIGPDDIITVNQRFF